MEDIKNAIVNQLDSLNPEVPVYDEQVEQGFQEPCFFVLQISSGQTKEVDRRYRRAMTFDVHYFPSDSLEKKAECQQVADKLYEHLEYVEWGGNVYRGQKLQHEVVDDVLHFLVSFDIHLMRQKNSVSKMRTFEQEGQIRHGN